MFLKILAIAIAVLGLQISSAVAAEMLVIDPYFRTASPNAKSGGAFLHLQNLSGQDDRLVGARSNIAKRVELHTHIDAGNGVMQMSKIENGIALPAGAQHDFVRGGDHLMFMGLTRTAVDGEEITVTLTFEHAGDVTIIIPVDSSRAPGDSAMKMDDN